MRGWQFLVAWRLAVGEEFLGVTGVGSEALHVLVGEGNPTLELRVLRVAAGGEAEASAEAGGELFLPWAVDFGEEALGKLTGELQRRVGENA